MTDRVIACNKNGRRRSFDVIKIKLVWNASLYVFVEDGHSLVGKRVVVEILALSSR